MLGKTNVKVKPNKKKPLIDYVEYIESTGTQHIDTGVPVTATTKIELEFELTSVPYGSFGIVGAFKSSSLGMALGLVHYVFQGAIGNSGYVNAGFSPTTNTKYTVVINDTAVVNNRAARTITINGEMYLHTTSAATSINKNCYIFYTNGVSINKISMKLYNCKIYENNVLVRDFKPCKDGTGIYCLYDEIEKRYCYNQGSGSFTGGASI
jgi:hypothetical protein